MFLVILVISLFKTSIYDAHLLKNLFFFVTVETFCVGFRTSTFVCMRACYTYKWLCACVIIVLSIIHKWRYRSRGLRWVPGSFPNLHPSPRAVPKKLPMYGKRPRIYRPVTAHLNGCAGEFEFILILLLLFFKSFLILMSWKLKF